MTAPAASTKGEDALFLALRTCVTHGAGPVRAVAEISASVRRGELSRADARAIADRCAQRFRDVPGVPADRVAAIDAFIEALWR